MAVKPRIKLDKKEAKKGDLVEVKALVSHVTDVLVVGDGNPNGGMATFHFTPLSGVAEANTRVRLATTQNIVAVAKMNDGSFYMASKQVKVTIGGCGG
jgi:sulfur-oxidizing protein SoxY